MATRLIAQALRIEQVGQHDQDLGALRHEGFPFPGEFEGARQVGLGALRVAGLVDSGKLPMQHHQYAGIEFPIPLEVCQRAFE